MPRRAPLSGPRILERLVLETPRRKARPRAVGEQLLPIRADEMRQQLSLPAMPVQPQSAVHGVDHPVAPTGELAVRRIGKQGRTMRQAIARELTGN